MHFQLTNGSMPDKRKMPKVKLFRMTSLPNKKKYPNRCPPNRDPKVRGGKQDPRLHSSEVTPQRNNRLQEKTTTRPHFEESCHPIRTENQNIEKNENNHRLHHDTSLLLFEVERNRSLIILFSEIHRPILTRV